MSLFVPITKVDVAQRLVYGTLTEEIPDKGGEILDYESAKPAFMEWSDEFRRNSGGKSLGNVRAMHGHVAAGKLTDLAFNDAEKRIQGVAKIVDDDEWNKVLEGVYTGFSIGGGYARRWPDTQNPSLMRYTPTLCEVSLVDNPAVPTATFDVVKIDGTVECRKFNQKKEAPVTPEPDNDNDASHCAQLLDELAWLEEELSEEGDEDMLAHVHALQDFLNGGGFESADMDAGEDDTSSHAYAGELARMNRAAFISEKVMERRIAKMANEVDALMKRIMKLEALPLPAKGSLRAIGKADDRRDAEEAFARLTPAERARELMKIALANPIEM